MRQAQLANAGLRQICLHHGCCYGKTKADLNAYKTRMPDPPATLQPREIELIADFLFAKIIGKGPMNHAKCVEFWGSET